MKNEIIIIGETADKHFKNRQAENPKGFYLNVKSKGKALIHKTDCWYLGDAERNKCCQ